MLKEKSRELERSEVGLNENHGRLVRIGEEINETDDIEAT